MQSLFGSVSSRWGASVAMSWLWGLGLSVGMATTSATGLGGLMGLLAVDAGGLWFFGWLMGAPGRDPIAAFAALRTRFFPAFAVVQVLAVSITAYVVGALVFGPLLGAVTGWALAAAISIAAIARAKRTSPDTLAKGHVVAMGVLFVGGVLAASSAYASVKGHAPRVLALPPLGQALTPGFVLGFMVGPWLDVQQWRRACYVHSVAGSVRRAYAIGGVGFALVLGVSALAVAPLVGVSPDFDPAALLAAPRAAAAGIAVGGPVGILGWVLLGAAILFTSIDSAQDALTWWMKDVASDAKAARGLPEGLVATTALTFVVSVLTVTAFATFGLSPIWLVLPFMTLFLGVGMTIWASAIGRPVRTDPSSVSTVLAVGVAATAMMGVGEATHSVPLVALGPIVAALGAMAARRSQAVHVPTEVVTTSIQEEVNHAR